MENYISQNIAYLVKKLNCSQDEFGTLFDLNRGNVNQYVKEKAQPKIETLQKISAYFKISIDDLINLDISVNNNYKESDKVNKLSEPETTYQSKDSIIQAQRETIEAQKETIQALKSEVTILRSQLGHAS